MFVSFCNTGQSRYDSRDTVPGLTPTRLVLNHLNDWVNRINGVGIDTFGWLNQTTNAGVGVFGKNPWSTIVRQLNLTERIFVDQVGAFGKRPRY